MIEVKLGPNTVELPYTLRLYGVSDVLFDELADEDTRAELIDGVMIVHSPASMAHDDVSGFVRALMSFYADARQLGKVLGPDSLVHLEAGRKLAPELFFIRREQVPTPLPPAFVGVPDLVVEVLSPSNRHHDLHDKRCLYRSAGVGEVWFIDPEFRQVIIDRRHADGYLEEVVTDGRIEAVVLPGFWVHASWLWAEPLPNRLSCLQALLHDT